MLMKGKKIKATKRNIPKPKKIVNQDVADYLGIAVSNISLYNKTPRSKRKLFLMKKGLQLEEGIEVQTTNKELAEYLDVAISTSYGYKKSKTGYKRYTLMMRGLQQLKAEKEFRQNYS